MDIITREEWGARPSVNGLYYPPFKPIEMYLHHTVGAGRVDIDGDGDMGDDYMRAVQIFHQDGRGWNDIAYNHLIDPVGLEVYEGRGWGAAPGAQKGHNVGTWAVAIMGDFRIQIPTQALLARIAELVAYGQEIGELPDNDMLGHRDAPDAQTSCPGGHLYMKLSTINQLIKEDQMTPEQKELLDALLAEQRRTGLTARDIFNVVRAVKVGEITDTKARRRLDAIAEAARE